MKAKWILLLVMAAALVALTPSCQKADDNSGTGRLVVKVTDAPFPMDIIESATITISKVELKKVCDEESEENPFIVLTEDTATFDLFELRNGVVDELLDMEIPVGEYEMIRLYVSEAGLKLKDGPEYNVKVPSGHQTGIKIIIKPALVVADGLTEELLLDFDLSRSFVLMGNPFTPAGIRGFIFKPVIRVVNNTTAGRVEGVVTDKSENMLKDAAVWLKQDTVITSSYTDSLGKYAIIGVPEGTYSLFSTKSGYDTVSFEGVKIYAGNRTVKNFELTPIR
ncbi:MAG: DUF4382 domain-containing protein [Bacteroidales bacterium]